MRGSEQLSLHYLFEKDESKGNCSSWVQLTLKGCFSSYSLMKMKQNECLAGFGVTWDVKKLNFLAENPRGCIIKWQNFAEILKQTGK